MKRSRKLFALGGVIASALWLMIGSVVASDSSLNAYGLSDVQVALADDAFIDWYAPSDPSFETQNEFISLMFANAASKGGETSLTGGEPATIHVTVTKFDILSTLELFFCCASNEVAAIFELRDAATGEAIRGPELLNFNHMGVGGVFGALASTEGQDQLTRVMNLIEAGTIAWLSPPSE